MRRSGKPCRADPDCFLLPFSRHSLPSIRSKLIALVLASVLPLVLGYIAFVHDAAQREREHVTRDAGTVARALTAALDRELDSAEAAARVAAAWPNLGPATLADFHDHAHALLRPEFPVTAFVLSGADGQPLLSTRLPAGKRPPTANLGAVRRVLERGDAVISGLHTPGVGQPEVVSAEIPVWHGGKVTYVLSAQIRPRRIADLLAAQQLPQGWIAEVFDSQGLVVARNIDHSRYIGGRMNAALAAALANSPEGAVTLAGREGEPDWYSVYARSDQHGWTVAVTYPEDAARALLGHTLPATVAISLALLGLSVLLAWTIGGSVARSVRQLSGPAAALGRGEPLRLPAPTIREVGVVSEVLHQVEGELQRYRSHLEQAVASRTVELERLNARVETVYASAPVGLCFLDRELRFVMINDHLANINALPAADHIGRTLPELFGELGAGFEQAYQRVRETRRPLRDIETSAALPSAPGTIRTWLSSYYPVFGAARELVGINAVVTEITERKLQEEQNRDNEEMFRVLFEASGDAQALLAYNANFISANAAAAALFGYDSVEDFINLSPASASPEFQPNGRRSDVVATELMRQALDEGGVQFEWVHRRRDGSNFHADVKLTALDVGGRGIMQVTIRDISARVAADAALRATSAQLRERERFIRTVTDNLPALVSYWDADARLRFANRPCLDWLGCSEDVALGRSAQELIAPEHMACFAPYLDGVLAGRPQRFECELPTPAGQPQREAIHVWGSYLPDVDADGRVRGAYKLHMNVTDLKRTESRLVLALGQAEQANRAKNEFLGNMSHEIRTPLNAIMGLARVLEEAPLGERERGHIAHIQNASKALLSLLSDLLDYARIESSELALERVPFRLDAVLDKVAAQLAPEARNKGLEPVFALAPGLPEQLLGDALRLEQVLLNLFANAVKFTERGEVMLGVALLRQTGACVRLRFTVRDTGIGIAPEVRQHIFAPFAQGDGSTSRKYGGAGLGLSIARRLAGLMGGELTLDSDTGVGACFHVVLDFGIAAPAIAAGGERPRVPATAAGDGTATALAAQLAGLRVLVVEDNAVNQEVARQVLLHAGARVELAANGRAALDLLAQDAAFDAVLMDLQMPVMNGFETTAAIRAMGLALPVVAMTANAMDEDRQRALEAGMDAHLPKPIDVDEMVATLLAVAGRSGAMRQAAPAAPAQASSPAPLPGIDLAAALARFSGNGAAYIALLRQFAATQAGAVDEIRALLAAGDLEGAARLTHRLRGVAGNLGAVEVAAEALRLENALRGADPEVAAPLAALDAAMATVLASARDAAREAEAAAAAAAEAAQAAPEPPPLAVRRDALVRLLGLLEANNMKAMTAFEALRPALAHALDSSAMLELSNVIALLRFEHAARLVRAILETKGDA